MSALVTCFIPFVSSSSRFTFVCWDLLVAFAPKDILLNNFAAWIARSTSFQAFAVWLERFGSSAIVKFSLLCFGVSFSTWWQNDCRDIRNTLVPHFEILGRSWNAFKEGTACFYFAVLLLCTTFPYLLGHWTWICDQRIKRRIGRRGVRACHGVASSPASLRYFHSFSRVALQ